MSRLFGWSLPPGCTNADIERAYGGDQPCEVCGQHVDNCICPECPVCQGYGDPQCYQNHGLVRTPEQVKLKAESDAAIARAIEEENRMWDEVQKGEVDGQ